MAELLVSPHVREVAVDGDAPQELPERPTSCRFTGQRTEPVRTRRGRERLCTEMLKTNTAKQWWVMPHRPRGLSLDILPSEPMRAWRALSIACQLAAQDPCAALFGFKPALLTFGRLNSIAVTQKMVPRMPPL